MASNARRNGVDLRGQHRVCRQPTSETRVLHRAKLRERADILRVLLDIHLSAALLDALLRLLRDILAPARFVSLRRALFGALIRPLVRALLRARVLVVASHDHLLVACFNRVCRRACLWSIGRQR